MKLYCDSCEEFVKAIIGEEKKKYQVKNKSVNVVVKITRCSKCNDEVFNEEIEEQNDLIVFDEYRKISGLLTTEEIKSIRSKYNLSQQNFGEILGFGAKTINRYENGSIQDLAHDNLMRLVENEYNFYKIWNKNKTSLKQSANIKIQKSFVESNDFEFSYDNSFVFIKYIEKDLDEASTNGC